jgi:hypothetical protein
VTPVDAELTFGGQHSTGQKEENMAKLQTGDTSQTEVHAETVNQMIANIEEYPRWLVLAFALAVGLALPSPLASWSGWRQRKALEKQIELLTTALAASQPTSITRPVGNPSSASSRLQT